MLSAVRTFFNTKGQKGHSIGVLPRQPHPILGFVPLPGYPNPFIDLPILTPLPRWEPFEQEAEVVAACGEDGVRGVAGFSCEVVAVHSMISLEVSDDGFDRGPGA